MEIKTHGGDIYSYINNRHAVPVDFSANINPLGLPKGVIKILKDSVTQFTAYPDVNCTKLKEAVSRYEKISQEFILFGNGAADIIFRLVYALKPANALLLAPTFSEYEAALKNVDCHIDYYYLKPENSFKIKDDLLEKIENKDILFICNPNNPTGMITDTGLLERITQKCRETNCLLVIDECFLDFSEYSEALSFKQFLNDYNNVLIIKAFTKIFAMAGLRLGYCLSSDRQLLKRLNAANQPWSVSVPAQLAGVEALKDSEYIKKTVESTKRERLYLTKRLRALELDVFESYSNFILFSITSDIDLYNELYKKGILIRKCEDFIGLGKHYYRIAVKNHKENKMLIISLKEIFKVYKTAGG